MSASLKDWLSIDFIRTLGSLVGVLICALSNLKKQSLLLGMLYQLTSNRLMHGVILLIAMLFKKNSKRLSLVQSKVSSSTDASGKCGTIAYVTALLLKSSTNLCTAYVSYSGRIRKKISITLSSS